MDVGGETADLMVKEGIQITEASIKLLAAGSKNLAAFLLALARDGKKLKGKTKMGRLLRADRELAIFRIKETEYKAFQQFSKQYGILFSAIKDRRRDDGILELISNVDYIPQINYTMERLGYPAPTWEQENSTPKKAVPRVRPGSSSPERGNGSTAFQMKKTATPDERPSVKGRLVALRAASEGMKGKAPQHTRNTPPKTR